MQNYLNSEIHDDAIYNKIPVRAASLHKNRDIQDYAHDFISTLSIYQVYVPSP